MNLVANRIGGADAGIDVFRNNSSSASPPIVAARNRILGNVTGVNNTTPGSVNAENNWWGCSAGPGAAGCDSTAGAVDSDPRLVLGASADPATIETGGKTSAITASVRRNSDGAVQPSPFFPATPSTFAASLGSIAPAATTLADGQAAATLTSGDQTGTSTVTAGLDNQTAAADVAFVAPSVDPGPAPGPGPGPEPGPVTAPTAQLVISHRRVPYAGGRIKLKLICRGGAGARCRGRLTLAATSATRRIRGAASSSARFDVAAGASQTIRVEPPNRLARQIRLRRRAVGKAIARLEALPGQTLSSRLVKRLITVQARRSTPR